MKKKLTILFLSIAATICCAVGLSACGDSSAHTHNYDQRVVTGEYLKSAATCTAKAVYYLSCECGEKGTETFEYGEPIPHAFNKRVVKEKYFKSAATCTGKAVYYLSCECGEKGTETFEYGSTVPHTVAVDKAVEATCTETGLTKGSHCSVCGTVIDEQKTVAALGHTLERHAAVAAACTDTGNSEYWECSVCGKYYSDKDGKNQIEDITSVVIPKLGHNFANGACTNCGISEPTRGLEYAKYSTYAAAVGIGTATDTDIVIADEYEGLPVTFIEISAFENCSSLLSVTIPTSVTDIGDYAFKGCTSLTEINYNANECSDNVGFVFDNAGKDGEGITVNIGASVKRIPVRLFSHSSKNYSPKIVSVVFAENSKCESIGKYAFYDCATLLSVSLPDSLTYIENSAFQNCTSLKSITIPDSVTSIGCNAFGKCTSLASVTIGRGVTHIWPYAFRCCFSLTNIKVDKNNAYYKSMDGNLYNYDGTTLIQYAIGKTNPSFEIPDCVTAIGDYAFYACTSLTSITIPNSVTRICDYAFSECTSLTDATFENTSGWVVGERTDFSPDKNISVDNLADTSAAANYLTDKYKYYYWIRN